MDKLADRVVQKYQSTSCQELIAKKSQPQKKEMLEQKAVEMLRKDADAYGVSQPGSRAHRQQDVRVRYNSLSVG